MVRSFVFKWYVLFPLLAVAGATAIAASLRPNWPPPAPLATATASPSGVTAAADALTGLEPGPGHVQHLAYGPRGDVTGVRLARRSDAGPEASARLALAGSASALAGRPVVVNLAYRPLPITTAEGVGFAWAPEGPWTSVALTPGEGLARVTLPAPSTGPEAIFLRIESARTDYNYGVELVELVLAPAAP